MGDDAIKKRIEVVRGFYTQMRSVAEELANDAERLVQERDQLARDHQQAIADVQRYAERAERAEQERDEERRKTREMAAATAAEEHLEAVLAHGWPEGTTGPACVRAAREHLRDTTKGKAKEAAAFEDGYRVAALEIAENRATHEQAKERGLYPENQDLRIFWDQGYDAACACYRLGRDPREVLTMFGPEVSPTHTTAALVGELLDGRWQFTTRPDPRDRQYFGKDFDWSWFPEAHRSDRSERSRAQEIRPAVEPQTCRVCCGSKTTRRRRNHGVVAFICGWCGGTGEEPRRG